MYYTITLDHTLITSDKTDFPLTVYLNGSAGTSNADATRIFYKLGSNWVKMQVLDSGGSDLYCLVEQWDVSNLKGVLHIKVPTYSSSTDTVIYIHFDPSQADNPTYIGAPGSTAAQSVCDSATVFFPTMSEDPTGGAGCIKDNTSNNADGTPSGSMLAGDLVDIDVGFGLDLDGTDDNVSFSYNAAHNITTTLTIEAIIKPEIQYDSGLTGYVGILDRQHSPSANQDSYNLTINPSGYLQLGSFGGNIQGTKATWAADTVFYIAATYNSTGLVGNLFVDGVKETLTTNSLDAMAGSTNNILVGGDGTNHDEFKGVVSELRISNSVRSDEWIATRFKSISDEIVAIEDSYVVNYNDLVFGVRLGRHFNMFFGECPAIANHFNMPFRSMYPVINYTEMKFGACLPITAYTDLPFLLYNNPKNHTDLYFALGDSVITNYHDTNFALLVGNPISAHHDLVYADVGEDPLTQDLTVSFTIDGKTINPHYVDLEFDDQSIGAVCELKLYAEDEAVLCTYGAVLVITIGAESETLYCEKTFSEDRRSKDSVEFTIKARSKSAHLLTVDKITAEYSAGMASSIAGAIATDYGITLDWQATDFPVKANSLYANNETPADVIRKLAEVVGAIMQDNDGTLEIVPFYEHPPWEWDSASVDVYVSDFSDFFTQGNSLDEREGFNRVLVSDQLTPEEQYRLEQEKITDFEKKLKVYQVPFDEDDEATLRHTGGSWVELEPYGTKTETITEEQVEIVDGHGQTQYPIYSIESSEYKQTNLGAITFGEDGKISTATAEESLVRITYVTKYKQWIARDLRSEDVQFVLEGEL